MIHDAVANRYPFSMPFGWFSVSETDELAVGQTKAAYYFGTHLVVWRDETGEAHVQDAFCPHLGAHLGHGGTIRNCEIECPFHGWKFNAEGDNTDIPYSERTNKKAKLKTYPVTEVNGFVFAWYHPQDAPPSWEMEEVVEIGTDDFAGPKKSKHVVQAGIQEMAENAVDSAHFRYVHHVAEVPEIVRYDMVDHQTFMESLQRFPTPRGVVDGQINAQQMGPGSSIVRFNGIIDTILVSASTPIDAGQTETRFHFYVKNLGDAATNSSVGDAFATEVDRQFVEDIPVWEHKAHLVRPALADNDGPFMKFRKWYSQFYAEETTTEHTVFPPPYWPEKMDETPAKATASAKHGDNA